MTSKTNESGSNAKSHFQPKNAVSQTVFLEHVPRVEHPPGNIFEVVTEPNVSPSLYNMVLTGNVGSFGANLKYSYMETDEDDDSAHDRPDYMKLNLMDVTHKEHYVDEFLSDPKNYEKENQSKEESKTPEQKANPEENEG